MANDQPDTAGTCMWEELKFGRPTRNEVHPKSALEVDCRVALRHILAYTLSS